MSKTVKLENWCVILERGNSYRAPELVCPVLAGTVYGHSHKPDGSKVETSRVVKIRGRVVTTRNTTYVLGKVDPKYREHLRTICPNWDWRHPVGKDKE